MKSLPYFHWYPADAATDENFSAMSDAEVGFLLRCLNHSWINYGLPADMDELARVRKVKRAYLDKMWVRVGKCFETSEKFPGRLINPRQEKERAAAISKSLSAAKSVGARYERSTNVDRTQEERSQNVPLRASESVSDSDSDSFVISPEPERTPVLVTGEAFSGASDPWHRYLSIYLLGGKLLNKEDESEAFPLWRRLRLPDQIAAIDHIKELVVIRQPEMIPDPVNHLRKKQWTRAGPGRMVPLPRKPSRTEIGHTKAAAEFLAEKKQ